MNRKSSPNAIRRRFDADVERFSSLETAQAATIDAVLAMNLVADAAAAATPNARALLDIGCGEYLVGLKDEAYRDHVFAYIDAEDSPRPLLYQLDLLRRVGFDQVDVLHKNGCFAAFGGIRS